MLCLLYLSRTYYHGRIYVWSLRDWNIKFNWELSKITGSLKWFQLVHTYFKMHRCWYKMRSNASDTWYDIEQTAHVGGFLHIYRKVHLFRLFISPFSRTISIRIFRKYRRYFIIQRGSAHSLSRPSFRESDIIAFLIKTNPKVYKVMTMLKFVLGKLAKIGWTYFLIH